MIRQYHAQRSRGGDNPLRVGVIPTGAIFYLQDEGWWRDRVRGAPSCRNPWIVEGFLNGLLCAARRNRDTGKWEDVYMARRSDMAVVRSLRDGRRRQVAVRILVLHEDEGLRRDPATYPDLPRLRAERPSTDRIIPPPSLGDVPPCLPVCHKPTSYNWRVYERHVLGVAAVCSRVVVERSGTKHADTSA